MAIHTALLCLLFASGATLTGGWPRIPAARLFLSLAGWSAVLLALPAVLSVGAAGRVSVLSEALVFALVPAVTVCIVAQTTPGFGAEAGSLRLLAPALAGLGGAALVLPFRLPASSAGRIWLGALVLSAVLAALAGVRLHTLLAGVRLLPACAVTCAACALLSGASDQFGGAFGAHLHGFTGRDLAVEAALCLLFDGPVILLTVWLLRTIRPVAFASRFLLVSLVTVLEGVGWLHPEITWALVAGILLLGGSGLALLFDAGEPA